MKRVVKEVGTPLAGIAVLIVIWGVASALTDSPALPSPATVWSAFVHGMSDGTIPEAAFKTMIRLAFSFALAIAIGTLIGVVSALYDVARRAVRPLVVALQITPFIAWLPLAVVWFGATERAVVFVTIMGAFPSVSLATMSSMRQVPPLLKRAGRTLGAEGWTLYRHVIFPAALPGYIAGLQQAWGFAWKALTAAELIVTAAGAVGLGQLLARSQDDVPTLLAALAVIVAIGVLVEYLVFNRLDRRVRRRRGLLIEG